MGGIILLSFLHGKVIPIKIIKMFSLFFLKKGKVITIDYRYVRIQK